VATGIVDGRQVDIPVQRKCRYYLGIDGVGITKRGDDSSFKYQGSFNRKIR